MLCVVFYALCCFGMPCTMCLVLMCLPCVVLCLMPYFCRQMCLYVLWCDLILSVVFACLVLCLCDSCVVLYCHYALGFCVPDVHVCLVSCFSAVRCNCMASDVNVFFLQEMESRWDGSSLNTSTTQELTKAKP